MRLSMRPSTHPSSVRAHSLNVAVQAFALGLLSGVILTSASSCQSAGAHPAYEHSIDQ